MSQMLGTMSEVILILGLLLTAAGAVYRIYCREKEPYKGKVMATVVDIVAGEPDSRGKEAGIHDYFYPVFAYYANGRLMKERYHKGSNPPSYRKGQQVNLKYDIKSPDRFEVEIKGREERIERFLYFAGIGMILMGFACYVLFGLRVMGW